MKLTEYPYLNKTLAIIDACQTDCEIDFSFNLPREFYDLTNPNNLKGLSISKFVNDKFYFKLTHSNKQNLLESLSTNFEDGEICHYTFYKDSMKIAEGYDHCELNFLNPEYFKLTDQHKEILEDVEVEFTVTIA